MPYGLIRHRGGEPELVLGSVNHLGQASVEWLRAVYRTGTVLAVGTWCSAFASLVHAVEDGDIFAVRARIRQ